MKINVRRCKINNKTKVYSCIKANYLQGHKDIANKLKMHWVDVIDACEDLERDGLDIGDAWRLEYMDMQFANSCEKPEWIV